MAYNHPAGSSSSFQQEQVAYSYFFESPSSTVHTASSTSTYPGSSSSSFSSYSSFMSSSTRPASSRQRNSSSYGRSVNSSPSSQPFVDAQFDIFEWHVQYQSCVRYFLDHAQYSGPVQAVAAFVNIQLPFQRPTHPILSSTPGSAPPGAPGVPSAGAASSRSAAAATAQPNAFVSLVPYIRRLIATAFDFPAVLHGFFGDDWATGIGPIHETERRNYLFAAKSDNWLKVKADYDLGADQTVPFLRPLQNVTEKEIVNAETTWSEWLAMQDWMLGPRAPGGVGGSSSSSRSRINIKMEDD